MTNVGDYLYICGGLNYETNEKYSSCHKLNLRSKVYESMEPMQRHRAVFELTYLDGHIYAIGGYSHQGNTPETGKPCERTVEAYDIRKNKWTFVKQHPASTGIQRSIQIRFFIQEDTA